MNDRPDESTATTQQPASVRDETAAQNDVRAADVRDTKTTGEQTPDSGFLPGDRMDDLQQRWRQVQESFVDDPRNAVQQAHDLVTRIVNDLTETFTRERSSLESQWSGGGEADTEDLRVALQRYRSFFNRLLGS